MPKPKAKASSRIDLFPNNHEQELFILYELSSKMEEEGNPSRLNRLILQEVIPLFNAEGGALLLKEPLSGDVMVAAEAGPNLERLKKIEPYFSSLIDIPEFHLLDHQSPFAAAREDLPKNEHWAVLPIRTAQETLGILLLYTSGSQGPSFPSYGSIFLKYLGFTIGHALKHVRLMEQARESEQRYRRIFEGSKDMLYETTKEGQFVDVNQAGVDLFKFSSREELLSFGSITSLYKRPEDRKKFVRAIEKQGFVKDYQVTFVNKSGEPMDVVITSTVRKDESGAILGYEGIIKDITPYTRLLKKLSASEAKYRAIVENSADGIAIHNEEGIQFTNKTFLNIFGYEEIAAIKGMDILQFIAPESRLKFLEWTHEYAGEGTRSRPLFEGQGLRMDGAVFLIEMRMFPISYEDHLAYQTILRDITGRKQMEEQLIQSERLAATGRLAFDIAHEINNPLAGIITYVHIVMEDLPEDSPERHNMEKILKAANRCKIIVKGLLDFARSETHEKEEVEVNSLIKDSLELVEGHLFFKKVKMNLQFHPGLPLLRAVRVKLEQVFLNMIVNAAEAMQGNGELKISTSFDSDLNMLVIVFQDTGPGIEPENLAKVFEPFFTTKQRGRGTGLGLAISHGIIKQHNGAIRVRSQPGKGATFIIELPV